MNTEMTSNNNTPIVLISNRDTDSDSNLQLPQLGDANLFKRARHRCNNRYAKVASLPKIKSNAELISHCMMNKPKEKKNNSSQCNSNSNSIRNHWQKMNMFLSPLVIQEENNELMLKPIESLNYIKRQLIKISTKSLSSEDNNNSHCNSILFKSVLVAQRKKPKEISLSKSNSQNKIIDLLKYFNAKEDNKKDINEINISSVGLISGEVKGKSIAKAKENHIGKGAFLLKERKRLQRNRSS